MTTILTFLFAVLAASLAADVGVSAKEAPSFAAFPNPGQGWSRKNDGHRQDGSFSWVHFKDTRSGDVVACVAWNTPNLDVDAAAVRQASIETITSNGYAYVSTHRLGEPIADTIRNHFVSIDVRNDSASKKFIVRAIEFSYVYENGGTSTSAMAHGYVVVVGDFTIIIQHTSRRVITSELASDLVLEVLMQRSVEETSISKGWSASISRSGG